MELRITDISKTYSNGVRALDSVSLTIPTGMFGLLGPNGSGKSTLMRTIATLQEPDTGTATLGEIDVLLEKDAVRRTLGYLPQDFGLYPNVSAETLLTHLATLKGFTSPRERRAVVESLLDRCNLWDIRKKRLGSYSGGTTQRFGIAQALIGDPELVIVDEPTAGLDPEERNRFLNTLSEIGENVIVILSTHIVEDVAEVCSRMAIVKDGRIILTGEPRSEIDKMRGKVWRKTIEKTALEDHEKRFRVLSTRLREGRTLIHVFSEECPDSTFEAAEPNLRDVYFKTLSEANGIGRAEGRTC